MRLRVSLLQGIPVPISCSPCQDSLPVGAALGCFYAGCARSGVLCRLFVTCAGVAVGVLDLGACATVYFIIDTYCLAQRWSMIVLIGSLGGIRESWRVASIHISLHDVHVV